MSSAAMMLRSKKAEPVSSHDYALSSPPFHVRSIPKNKLVVIDAIELKKLSQKIDGADVNEQRQKLIQEDKLNRQKLSKNRMKNWDNTIVGQRRKKLEARQARHAEEEAQRQELDKIFREENEAQRSASIDRAKKLQYYGTDTVKNFHSRVILLEVLQERDMQLVIKKKSALRNEQLDAYYLQVANDKASKGLAEDQKNLIEAKEKKVNIAKEQAKQHQEKLDNQKKERLAFLEEGKQIAKDHAAYKKEQKLAESVRWQNTLLLRKQLDDMKQETKSHREADRKKEEESDKRIQSWVARKAKQNHLKKELEQKWFNEKFNRQMALGETQAILKGNAEAKLNEQIAQRVKMTVDKEKKRLEDQYAKKKSREKEIRDFYDNFHKLQSENSRSQKEKDRQELQEYLRIQAENVAQKEAQKANQLKEGKALQEVHRKQILANEIKKKTERDAFLAEATDMTQIAAAEERRLHDYMNALAKEIWATSNVRLQRYVDEETHRPSERAPRLADKYRKDTTGRLGFETNAHYTKDDLARSNPICTGDFETFLNDQKKAKKKGHL